MQQRVSQKYNIKGNDFVRWKFVREQTVAGTSWYQLALFGTIWDQLVSISALGPWFHGIWLPWYHGIWQSLRQMGVRVRVTERFL